MISRLAPTALLITLVALSMPPPASAAEQPDVLRRAPYYLSLHSAEGEARGTVLLLHGGGWHGGLGAAADELMASSISSLRGWGYDVANLGYRSGAASLDDAIAAFDLLRQRRGASEPICIYGASAGAQLGLMVAARRGPSVDCVVDLLGPPDLLHFGSKRLSANGEAQARQAFGAARLAALSPINNASRIRSPVLVGAAPCDAYIDLESQREFVQELKAAGDDAQLEVIAAGDDVDLEHCTVDDASFRRFQAATRSFLDTAATSPPAATAPPEGDDPAIPFGLVLAGAIVVIGGLVVAWARRRRATQKR